ncbi:MULTISPECIES: hypothetical protein [unclassified Helicobacter]|uniref:hypothetical protein n=1 Tax=unclassified Helicobacter TaxID=2593540 RepID=UPI00115FEA18|nr:MULTISPECIES: hypothetical protein [unclassified Helicobacter]
MINTRYMRIDRGCLFAVSLVLCGALVCAKAESSSRYNSASNASNSFLRVASNDTSNASSDASRVSSSVDKMLDSDTGGLDAESGSAESSAESAPTTSATLTAPAESATPATPATPAPTKPKNTISINSALVKRHALTLGFGFFGGDRIVKYQEAKVTIPSEIGQSLPQKLRATDSSILAMIGGIYRMTKRNTLRYMFNLGYSNICLYGEGESENLDRIHGLKYGAKLVWEWSFYRGEVVSWNSILGAEYANAYYKKDSTNMLIGEISPQVGVGVEIRYRHYIEYIIAMPLFSKLKIESNQESFYIPQGFDHIRSGINYMYRF